MSKLARCATVHLPIPVPTGFTYAVPEGLVEGLVPGRRVRVPFGNRTMPGWFTGWDEAPEPGEGGRAVELKAVEALLDDGPLVDREMLGLARWMAERYACSWGEAISACVPGGVRSETAEATVLHARLAVPADEADRKAAALPARHVKRARILRILCEHPEGLAVRDLVRSAQCTDSPVQTLAKQGLVRLSRRGLDLDVFAGAEPEPLVDVELSGAQAAALAAIEGPLAAGLHAVFLLFGVTGSGKTEVYLRAIRRAVEAGRQAVVLVPEISLTPQTVARFRGWFERVAVLHSGLTDAERRRQWREIREARADVVIGPRSALFAPVPRLGLVVVDEEHEPSFKQGHAPRYHARDVAVERAARSGAVVIMGTATPSLESWQLALDGTYQLLRLPGRVGAGSLPRVELVDMLEEAHVTKRRALLSRRLVQLLEQAFARRDQAILFLNRRGFASALFCGRCGVSAGCPRCSVSLTLHRAHGTVLCHQCGLEGPPPVDCPSCGLGKMARLGAGTERLEDAVRGLFPGLRMARMDSDSMHDRESYEQVLGRFGRGDLDLLLGTQMIAKGLHFPRVTVVGVVSADMGLMVPDFRATERTFQLVAQVAGRAGRADRPGRVVVQTVQPSHEALRRAAEHDFEGFAAGELLERRRFGWPPATRLVRAVVSAREERAARERALQVAEALRAALPPGGATVMGPAPCPVLRLRNRFRWQVVVKAADLPVQHASVLRLRRFSHRASGTELTVDVDPVDLV